MQFRHALVSRCLVFALAALNASAGEPRAAKALPRSESALRASPEMWDLAGNKLADGEFEQTVDGNHLHIRIKYNFKDGLRIQETGVFRQSPGPVEENWEWTETRGKEITRHLKVDFTSGKALVEHRHNSDVKRWEETLKIVPGQTFAGYGFVLAIENARTQLLKGKTIPVQAIGFTPKPRLVTVQLSCAGLDQMSMGGQTLRGDRFIIHPDVPAIAKAFVTVEDTLIWLTQSPDVGFLRWEGARVEADDPIIRVDRLPGRYSSSAEPVAKNQRNRK